MFPDRVDRLCTSGTERGRHAEQERRGHGHSCGKREDTPIDADIVVVAAGPWVARLLPALGKRVTPSRQLVAYVRPPEALAPLWAWAPMLLHIGREDGIYVVPPVAGHGMKLGDHRFVMGGDPDHDRDASEAELRSVEREGPPHVVGPRAVGERPPAP